MIVPAIVNYFQNHSDARGIPNITNSDWLSFIQQSEQKDIKDSLAEYVTANNIPFPAKEISYDEFMDLFLRFVNTSMLGEYKDFDIVLEKVDYKYKYSDNPLGVIDKSHAYNAVSNYFQQLNRMKCGSNLVDSPYDIWTNKDKLSKMNWHFWRLGALGKSDINDSTFRSGFRIGTYTATQFKPNVAKALYEKHNAHKVLDTSCGWGDRLAGFYATKSTELYVGCDPNPEVYNAYKDQCAEYEKLLGCSNPVLCDNGDHFICTGTKQVIIYNLPSEDVNWKLYANTFDFYFTSPPYFETERYASNNSATQSWSRYPTFDSWKHDFFFKVNRLVWDTLLDDAFMMINIIEPRINNGTRLNLCDDMVDDILSYPNAHYLGKIGMRMQARPHAIVEADKNSIFIEPIWVFRKNNNQYLDAKPFDMLFDMSK
jgi:hypothetical protein